ncbi:MAG: hypothetical protein DRP63_01410 [Planctomycetota bacterium]|nr:MAG: hypothetical protein DRP63_01410 [Planctomycetota bacterium]
MAERKTGAIAFVVLLYVVAAGGFGFGLYQRSKSKEVLNSLNQLAQQQHQYEAWKQEREELQRKFKRIISAINRLNKILPNVAGLDAFAKQIEAFAKDSTLTIKRLIPVRRMGKQQQQGYHRFQFTLECTGTWKGFCEFLKKIEAWDRFVKVDAFKLSAEKEPIPESNLLNISITLSTFVYK